MPGHLFALLLAVFVPAAEPQPIVVSAAISLTDALQEVKKAFTAAGGSAVRFNFAGSNVLARQVVNGAPADVFISADEAQMDYAERNGAIDPSTRVNLLANRLAVVTPRGRGHTIPDARALLGVRRIALADPAGVPAGVYARHFLERTGIWAGLQSRLLALSNVRAALSAAESGAADAAIVYESDAAASSGVDLAFVVTGGAAPRIVYPAAIVARTKQRDAAMAFLVFVRGSEASEIFRRYRFTIPPVPQSGALADPE